MALAKYRDVRVAREVSPGAPTIPSLRNRVSRAWAALGIDRPGMGRILAPRWAVTIPVVAMALILGGALLEPAPAHENTGALLVVEDLTTAVLMVGLVGSVVGAMTLRRAGIASALGVSLFSLGVVVACPLSGHHTFGAWWGGELAIIFAATGLAAWGLLRTNR